MAELSERDVALLEFEAHCSSRVGSKAAAARAQFGWSLTRHYQALYALLDKTAAVRADPVLVHRLIRLREARVMSRTSGMATKTAT